MNVRKIVEISYQSSYCCYSGLDITDVDGSEVKVTLNDDSWLELGRRVGDKCTSILKKRDEGTQEKVDAAVASALDGYRSELNEAKTYKV